MFIHAGRNCQGGFCSTVMVFQIIVTGLHTPNEHHCHCSLPKADTLDRRVKGDILLNHDAELTVQPQSLGQAPKAGECRENRIL